MAKKQYFAWFTYSNILTLSRIVLAGAVMFFVSKQAWKSSFIVILLASVSDFLDGYFARLFNQETYLGLLLDPVADKVFIVCCFYALVFLGSPSFHLPVWFFILECVRELTILGGAFILLRLHKGFKVLPTIFGKLNTFFQLSFICWLFICRFFNWHPKQSFYIIFLSIVLFSICSFLHYTFIALTYIYKVKKCQK